MDQTTSQSRNSIKNKEIFISGGAGYLGKNLIKRFYANNFITVYSRDEAKHYELKSQFPRIRFVVGDVADRDRLFDAASRCDYAIYAASLKQISACDENPSEAIKTICNGAINSKNASLKSTKIKKSVFISTDKACAATTIYGACKYVAEQSFLTKVIGEISAPNRTSLRYGNVTNSTGSIIRVLNKAIVNNEIVNLYSSDMTRFLIDVSDAVSMVEDSLLDLSETNGQCLVPIIKSFKIADLFEIYNEVYGLKFNICSPRVGEKIHETMICEEESLRSKFIYANGHKYIAIDQLNTYKDSNISQFLVNNQFSSKDHCLTKEELKEYLAKNEYFINRT